MTEQAGTPSARDEDASQLERIARRIERTGGRDPRSADLDSPESAPHPDNGDFRPPADAGVIAELLLSERYKGSFPHPDVLEKLNACVPNGAERAFALTELEQRDRHENNRRFLEAKIRLIDAEVRRSDRISTDRRIVILGALSILALTLAGAFILAFLGMTGGAALLGAGGIATVIAALAATLKRDGSTGDVKPTPK
jgi:uncharacterized membrane protein